MTMNKCLFIIPYFGKLPTYFSLWLKTASTCSNFDFLIITDDNYESTYNNIEILKMDFKSFRTLCQSKFDFPISLQSPRKLCDFKPAYGYILEDKLIGYSYWGYCDIDIILGDIDKLVPLEAGYDKLFVHGHMTILRNTYEINRIFKTNVKGFKDYKDVFSSENNCVFDEPSDNININLISKQLGLKIYYDYNIADINAYSYLFKRSLYDYGCTSKKNRETRTEKIKKQLYYWSDGSLFRFYLKNNKVESDEMRYFHFQKRILRIDPTVLKSSSFLIIPNKVIPYEGEITKKTINKLVKDKIIYPQYFKLKFNNLRKKLKGL